MASKIILFLSGLKSEAEEKEYICPDKTKVSGVQTNDAPVRYLLRSDPAVGEVVCVVTRQARQSALEHFERVVKEAAPNARIAAIPYDEDQDFSETAIPAILDRVERGDRIYLDVTGGFRSANMYLLLLSRVLSYKGIHTAGAVYSNFNAAAVEDVSHLFRLFDLVGGMQELTSLGSVRTLRGYYEAEPDAQDPAVREVIDCMARLTEDITLCHTALIKQRMEEFNAAMDRAGSCPDPLMRQLLDVFRRTFGRKMTTVGLIRWCVGNDMIQQALTVYTEHVPDIIMSGEILRRESWVEDVPKRAYENQAVVQFLRGFLMLSEGTAFAGDSSADLCKILREYARNNRGTIVRMARGDAAPVLPPEIAVGVENAALVARLAYPDGGRFNADWADDLPPEKAGLRRLEERFSSHIVPGNAASFINDVSAFSAAHLGVLLEVEGELTAADSSGVYAKTLRCLPQLLPSSGYVPMCSVEELAQVSRDYLYIKALRNLTNHANERPTDNQEQILSYLEECGYARAEDLSLSDVKAAVLTALDNLRKAREGKKKA